MGVGDLTAGARWVSFEDGPSGLRERVRVEHFDGDGERAGAYDTARSRLISHARTRYAVALAWTANEDGDAPERPTVPGHTEQDHSPTRGSTQHRCVRRVPDGHRRGGRYRHRWTGTASTPRFTDGSSLDSEDSFPGPNAPGTVDVGLDARGQCPSRETDRRQ